MNIQIDIECETIAELIQHLGEIHRQVERQARINGADIASDDFPLGTILCDNNCYGTH